MKPKAYKRGYPVAILLGLENDHATLWHVYSQVAKSQQTIILTSDRKDSKAVYIFHESIINALRPTLKEGIRSIIIASPAKTNYAQELLNHVKAHHSWLLQGVNKATFSQIIGLASTTTQIATLTKTNLFKQLIKETASEETENLMEILEKRLNTKDNLVFFSLEEAENIILNKQTTRKPSPEYLLLTDSYLSSNSQKNRVQRLLQIAKNRSVKTRIINAESNAGIRLTQLGGLVCLAKLELNTI